MSVEQVTLNLISSSPEETIEFGRRLGENLPPGAVVLLSGELGTGKTVFVKGISLGLGFVSPETVTSPSFVIMNIYPARLPVYHIDLYRIGTSREVADLDLEDYLGGDGVAVVEWGEILPREYLPESWVEVQMEMGDGGSRRITLRGPAKILPESLAK